VNSAVYDAHRVFTSGVWSRADPTERFRVLSRIAMLLRENAAELAARTVLLGGGL
jgi:acyl-CoA reductase-like NAD-dependent aldehyde dehydrogenase